ncbi:MAG: DedA family protein [Thermodesulfobacteriota bacterium]|nr:DedA family protein [Thermodesulfobacteriota bacterium]
MEMIVSWLVETIARFGYAGIVGLMFLESSFFPFPSEVVIPPAGYLASRGDMDLYMVIIMGIMGSLMGALFNYFIALFIGRPLLTKYGRYIFLSEHRLAKMDAFFFTHGEISIFTTRMVPGIRQYISFPAGLARMSLVKFSIYTAMGAAIWVGILAWIGFTVGNNMDMVRQYSRHATLTLVCGIGVIVCLYIWRYRRQKR